MSKAQEVKYDKKIWLRLFPPINHNKLKQLRMTNTGLYSIANNTIRKDLVHLLNIILNIYKDILPDNITITEASGGLGGLSIAILQNFADIKMNIVEYDKLHYDILVNNINLYEFKQDIEFINDDYIDISTRLNQDIIIADPPWGGYSYKKYKKIRLGYNGINIAYTINTLFKEKKAKIFILLAPYNFDIDNFYMLINSKYINLYKTQKHFYVYVCNDLFLDTCTTKPTISS